MLTLAIESTAVTASAALVRDGELIGVYSELRRNPQRNPSANG